VGNKTNRSLVIHTDLERVGYNIMTKKKFYIMRGLPGSGKSYTAKEIVGDGQIFSADDYWYIENPDKYQFDGSRLRDAHAWNQRRVEEAVKADIPIIVVDNTNTTLKELKFYSPMIQEALKKGYTVELVEPRTSWAFDVDECFKRNSHNVPLDVVQRMADRYVKDVKVEDILSLQI